MARENSNLAKRKLLHCSEKEAEKTGKLMSTPINNS